MKKNRILFGAIVLCLLLSSLSWAQVKLTGDISGLVIYTNDESLSGVTLTLTGEKLFQKSLTTISNDRGIFRFLNLNPGNYFIECTLAGFNPMKISAVVSVGKKTSVRALSASRADRRPHRLPASFEHGPVRLGTAVDRRHARRRPEFLLRCRRGARL